MTGRAIRVWLFCIALLLGAAQAAAGADYPRGWLDADGDCQNSRQEALIAQATGPLHYATKRKCRVLRGRWVSPYTEAVIYDASKIDIDHVVPLQWAWSHGADQWPYERWMQFVNDPVNLLAVEARLNRQKGAKGPDRWLPPRNRCAYVLRFLRILKRYRLDAGAGDRFAALRERVCSWS